MKKIIKGASRWFSSNMYIVQLFIAIAILIFWGYHDSTDSITLWSISIILIVLSVDVFLLCVTYLEKINRKLDKISEKGTYIELISRNDFDVGKAIKNASHDIFISGTALASLCSYIQELQVFPKGKTLRLVSLDFDDKQCIEQMCKITGMELTFDDLKKEDIAFEMIRTNRMITKNNAIEIRKIKKIMPIVYCAVDILDIKKTSFIKVQHYLHEKSGSECINYIVRPGNELFVYYLEQIKILWEQGKE